VSIFDHPDVVPAAPTWRCPHCRTLQPEASRCRACSRAAVTCATCHLYRRSVATDLAYCATDRAHTPLDSDEVCARWEATPGLDAAPGLFDDLEMIASAPQSHAAAPSSKPSPPAAVAPEELPIPAWEPATPPGGLVEAPHVAPGLQLMSEVQRRSRRSRAG